MRAVSVGQRGPEAGGCAQFCALVLATLFYNGHSAQVEGGTISSAAGQR